MIRLHHCHETRSMRVLWLLHEMDLPFDLVVYPFDKTLRSETYLALHPVGRVPSLELDGEILWESGAILEVLCERYPDTGLGREPGHPERAEWLIWVHFAESVSQHTAALTQQHVALYEDHMRSPIVMKLEAKRLAKCFEAIEARLQGREHLLDGGFSAADVAVGQAVLMGRRFVRLSAYPALSAWYDKITERPAAQASMPPPGEGLYAREFYEPIDG